MPLFLKIKSFFFFAIVLVYVGLPMAQYSMGVQDVFAQEEGVEGGVEESEAQNSENEQSGALQKVKNFFNAIKSWLGDKLKFFTDKVDSALGVDSDNKGTNALFGLPLYILVAFFGLFAIKLVFNILRDMLKAIFSGDDGKPKGKNRR